MRALVTGGGGFLGRYVVEQLRARGDTVRSFSRGRYPELEALGVECVAGDLRDPAAVAPAVAGADVVFHVASLAAAWGHYRDFHAINVRGTQNVIAACRVHGIRKLVYTSTPSVAFPMGDLKGVDESQPYPPKFYAHYPATKAQAEQLVLQANDATLSTCALRPHLIWGPRDSHLLPMLAQRARQGKLVQIGDGTNLIDITYVEHAAAAHLLAADKLAPDTPVAGQAYFISDGDPVSLWDFVGELLRRLDLPPPRRHLSAGTAMALATVLEAAHTILPCLGEPRLTRFLASNFATSHYFDISRARRDLGYAPSVSREEGLRRTVAWYHETFADPKA